MSNWYQFLMRCKSKQGNFVTNGIKNAKPQNYQRGVDQQSRECSVH